MRVGITLQIEIGDVQKFMDHTAEFTGALVRENDKHEETTPKENIETDTEDAATKKKATKKKATKKKAAKKKVTKEDLRAVMQQVLTKLNMAAVTGVLNTFGAHKLDEVKPEDYLDVIGTYNELLKGVKDEG